jgi:hypothetical protein
MPDEGLALYTLCEQAGLKPHRLTDQEATVLVTEHAARIIGVFPGPAEPNLLWVNAAAFGGVEALRRFIHAGEWNLGGDRVWVAPEIELHFSDPQNPSHQNYTVPPALDPGRWSLEQADTFGVALRNAGEAKNLVSNQSFRFETRRQIRLAAAPVDVTDLHYIGYETASAIVITAPDRPDAAYGLWQLMQIPPGGEILIPARPDAEQVDYFKTDLSQHVRIAEGHLVFPVTGTQQHKLGLRPHDVRGLMGYLRQDGENATLIVRQAAVFPGATYADYPGDARDRRDIALQFYNDSGDTGGFGEMEYHSIAADAAGFFNTRDVSRTWCFAGPLPRIRTVASELLGITQLAG